MRSTPMIPAAARPASATGSPTTLRICATTIDPLGRTGGPCSTPIAIYRNCQCRTNGLLKQSMTRLAEVTDGLSQTIVVTEDAGRDARFMSAYSEYYVTPVLNVTRPVAPASAASGGGPSPTARSSRRR